MTIAASPPRALPAAQIWLATIGLALVLATVAAPGLHKQHGGWVLIGVFALGGLGAYAAVRLGEGVDQRSALIVILAAAVAMRLAMLMVDPYLSTDIYRYIWDGRVQAAGINPYRYVPNAPELAHLRDSTISPHINRADYAVTIYPPVAQAFFLAVTRLGESVLAMKIALIACECATIAAIIAVLQRLGAPATRIAAYAWHPLPVWEIAGNGHVDAAMMALLFAGLLAFVNGRTLLAGVLATAGALIKPVALLALPVFWRSWGWRLPLAVAAVVAVAYLPYLSVGTGVLGFLPGYVEEEGLASGSGFKLLWLLERLAGPLPHAGTVYLAFTALALIGLAVATAFRSDRTEPAAIRALRWLLVAFLVLVSPHYPWYFLALVPFLSLSPSLTAWVLTLACVLFYDATGHGTLPAYDVRITVFTLASLAAVGHDLWREWRRPLPAAPGDSP